MAQAQNMPLATVTLKSGENTPLTYTMMGSKKTFKAGIGVPVNSAAELRKLESCGYFDIQRHEQPVAPKPKPQRGAPPSPPAADDDEGDGDDASNAADDDGAGDDGDPDDDDAPPPPPPKTKPAPAPKPAAAAPAPKKTPAR